MILSSGKNTNPDEHLLALVKSGYLDNKSPVTNKNLNGLHRCRKLSAAYLVAGIGQASSLRQLKADLVHCLNSN